MRYSRIQACVGAFIFFLALPLFANAHENTTVRITADAFIPDIIEVHAGDTVTFANEDGSLHWVASNLHPTHTQYPGSDIRWCDTLEHARAFDTCRGLEKGEEYRFTFSEPGTWDFHDHLHPLLEGTVTVQGTATARAAPLASSLTTGKRFLVVLERFFYTVFNRQGEKRVSELNLIQVTKEDSDLEFWMRVFGYERVLGELEKDATDPALRGKKAEVLVGECHAAGHVVGRLAYKIYGMSLLNESVLDTRCQFGFYHGYIEASLGNVGTDETVKEFAEKCEKYIQEPVRRVFCQHVIGHGLMIFHNYDLPFAIRKCHELVETDLGRRMCYHGAFMENVFVTLGLGYVTHETPWVDTDRPDFPCNADALPELPHVLEMCFFNQSALWAQPFKQFKYKNAVAGCERIPRELRDMCFIGLGFNMAFPLATLSDVQVTERCGEAPEFSDQHNCLIGALFMRSTHWGTFRGFKNPTFCTALSIEDGDACDAHLRSSLPWLFEQQSPARN